jgi:uncharacterized protein YfiM (DUF2279 family)
VQDATSANAASTIAAGGDSGSAVAVDHAIHAEHSSATGDLIGEHRKIRRARCGQCGIND